MIYLQHKISTELLNSEWMNVQLSEKKIRQIYTYMSTPCHWEYLSLGGISKYLVLEYQRCRRVATVCPWEAPCS